MPSDLKDGTVQQLFAVNDSNQAYVVAVTSQPNGYSLVAAQPVQDNTPLRKGQIQQAQAQYAHFQQPLVSNDGLHLWGVLGNQLAELTFPLSTSQLQPAAAPAYPVPTPQECASGQLMAGAFSGQSNPPHVAVTCQVDAADGGPPTQYLYVDDVRVGSATGNKTPFSLRHYVYVNGTHILITGNDFGPPLYVSYGTNLSALSTPKLFSLSTAANEFSTLVGLEPLPTNDGVMAFGAVLTGSDGGPPSIVPATLLSRTVSLSQLDQLVTTPATGFAPFLTVTKAQDVPGYSVPTVFSNELLYAAPNPLVPDNVHMMILSRDGKVLLPSTLVYSAPSGTTIGSAAIAQLGAHTLVVWAESKPGPDGGTIDRVRGQAYFCQKRP